MQRQPKSIKDASQLLQLIDLLSVTGRQIIHEWSKESERPDMVDPILPSRELHEMQRTVLAVAGSLVEMVSEPSSRLMQVSMQYFEARALHLAAERRIPDLLSSAHARKDGGYGAGLSIKEISNATGIEPLKLSRLLRCLCSLHIFKEVQNDRFDNNVISAALVGNEPLRAYIVMYGSHHYTASDHLPRYLLDAKKGASYEVNETPLQEAVGTSKSLFEWLEEKVPARELKEHANYPGFFDSYISEVNDCESESVVPRPELGNFGLSMLGGGRVNGTAHVYGMKEQIIGYIMAGSRLISEDYPWTALGDAVVVDVGGGVGGFVLQLSQHYPRLNFVIQDRGPVLKQAQEEVWPKENLRALEDGRVRFIEHDFFERNPIEGADIYWLRAILHDWSDEYCIQILKAIRQSMTAKSRILICDQVMDTTLGCPELTPAPLPLLANYGYYARYSHSRDLAMMTVINGIERTPAQFKELIEAAGLKLQKIWECRSPLSLVEVVLSQN